MEARSVAFAASAGGGPVRARQLQALEPVIAAATSSGDRIAILGDFNATGPEDVENIGAFARKLDLSFASEHVPCTSYWSRNDGCVGVALDQALARRAVEILEATYRRIGDALQFYPTQSVEVVLYTSQQFRDITRSPSWAGGVYDGRIRVPVRGALEQPGDLERVLAHEYVHALVAGVASRGVPAWVDEGLAMVLEPSSLVGAQRIVASVRRRPRLSELHAGFGNLPDAQATIAYAESALAARARTTFVRWPKLSPLPHLAMGKYLILCLRG